MLPTADGWRGSADGGFINRDERKRTLSRDRDRSRSPLRDRRRRSSPPARERRSVDARNDRMVYLSNIPYDVRWMEIKDLVREKAGEVVFVEVLEDRDGKPKGSAVVEFKNKESVERCIEALHRFEMKGRQVVAKEIRDPVAFFRKVREDTGMDFLNGRSGGDGLGEGYGKGRERLPSTGDVGETYGLSPQFLRQLHIEGPLNNRVFVANLGYNVSSGKLFDVFTLAGKVTWLDLQMDKEGKSKGLAVVQYSHPIEAVQAISMLNGQRLYDRPMTVKMDRFEKEAELREGELPVGLRAVGMGLGANGAPLADVASVVSSVTTNISAPLSRAPEPYYSPQEPPYQSPTGGAAYQGTMATQQPSSYSSGGTPSAGGGGYVGQFSKPSNQSAGFGGAASTQGSANTSGFGGGPGVYSGSSGGGSAYGGYNAYAGSAESFNVTRSLLIKNLPPDYSWSIVRDRVQQFGAVESCEMIGAGVAKVKYYNVADAERAKVTLQGSSVEGRAIGIEYL